MDPTGPFKFAVFPDVAAGEAAFQALIARHVAVGHTIYELMRRYAPPSSNNTTAYVAAVAGAVKAKPTDKLSSLSQAQLDILKETIRQAEGWRDRNRELSPPVVTPAR